MTDKPLRAIHGSPDRPLRIGNIEIPCYVLENGMRVLSGRGMQGALGLGQTHGTLLRTFLAQESLKPFINAKLAMDITNPLRFVRPGRGGKLAVCYEATILADICDAILEARKTRHLSDKQEFIADHCEILVRGFARVGIIALVDEATGYQQVRNRQALEEILEKFIAKELNKWAKTFPDEFYELMFHLKGWPYDPKSVKRPSIIGRYTIDLVYKRLAPGVLEELRRKNPPSEKGRRKHKYFQWLTEDVGHARLREHLAAVMALMRNATTWDRFYGSMQRALPQYGETIEMFPELWGEEDSTD
jgi:hypothetical protein